MRVCVCVLIKRFFSCVIINERPRNHRQLVHLNERVRKTGVRVFVRVCRKECAAWNFIEIFGKS